MAFARDLPGGKLAAEVRVSRKLRGLLANPVGMFLLLSGVFGLIALSVDPPLRAPDESAHFLRIVGIAQGDFAATARDERGRKGLFVPASLYDGFGFFDASRRYIETPGFSYRNVFDRYLHRGAAQPGEDRAPVFAIYEGSEAYSPAPYLQYLPAALIGRLFDFDFLVQLYLMRLTGFLIMTAVVAYAIAVIPRLKWAFLVIATLPSALLARSSITADAATLSFTLAGTALCLRNICTPEPPRFWQRAAFMTLSSLTKPPQVIFLMLELIAHPWRDLPRRWRSIVLLMLPGVVLTLLWVATAADPATWRVIEGTQTPAELFEPQRKWQLLMHRPWHFPELIVGSLDPYDAKEIWRQLIGILGWLDTALMPWVYPLLSALLLASFLAPLPLGPGARYRIAAVSIVAALAYFLAVYFIFYMTWTPVNAEEIWGVQGRYFLVMLAPLAIACAALVNRGPGEDVRAALAISSACVSGAAVLEALLRANW
jgi:uncharacterized membrane protein